MPNEPAQNLHTITLAPTQYTVGPGPQAQPNAVSPGQQAPPRYGIKDAVSAYSAWYDKHTQDIAKKNIGITKILFPIAAALGAAAVLYMGLTTQHDTLRQPMPQPRITADDESVLEATVKHVRGDENRLQQIAGSDRHITIEEAYRAGVPLQRK